MDIKIHQKQNRLFSLILFCFLPIVAITLITLNVDAATHESAEINQSDDFISSSLNASSNITTPVPISATAYFPLIFGMPIPAPNVVASVPSKSGNKFVWDLTWTQNNEPNNATYTIVESNSPTMQPILNTRTVTSSHSSSFDHAPGLNNVFYYTVRLNHPNAEISEPVKVVSAYYDSFDDPSSGWATRREDFDDTDNEMSYTNDGSLKMHVHGRWDYFVTSPLATAPPPPYRISTSVRFAGPGNLNTYGIIFGGDNNGKACPTIFPPNGRSADLTDREEFDVLPIGVRAPEATNNVVDNCLNYYYRMMFLWKDGFGSMLAELKEVYYHSDNNSGRGIALSGNDFLELPVSSGSANGWNEWSIEVYPDGVIKIFSGPDRVYQAISDKDFLINGPAFGFWASTDEYPGSDPLYSYILVEPIN